MKCPDCGSENLEGSKFCSFCAKKFPQAIRCPSCGGENLEGAVFCSLCGRRFDSEGAAARQAAAPTPVKSVPRAAAAGAEPGVEAKKGGTSATQFCHVCHEPTPSDHLMFDIDGHHVCKKCLTEGGKAKSGRTRAIEAIKAQVEGTAPSQVSRMTGTKGTQIHREALPNMDEKRSVLPYVALIILVLAGSAAGAWYYFVVVKKIDPMQWLRPGGSAPAPAATPDKAEASKKEEPGDEAPVPEKAEVFVGTYLGPNPGEGELAGAMVFESKAKEKLYVTLPEDLRDIAKSFAPGKSYTFKYRPGADFAATRRITRDQLVGAIKETK
jgi:hypothetical protein